MTNFESFKIKAEFFVPNEIYLANPCHNYVKNSVYRKLVCITSN